MWEQLEGKNAVIEALRARRQPESLWLQKGQKETQWASLLRLANSLGVRPIYLEKVEMDAQSQSGRHQGVIARFPAYDYASVEELLEKAAQRQEAPFLLLLDGIEDPHNLGAIIRSAHQAGAHGVIIPKNRAVGLNATVARVSAGAINYLPVARVTNLVQTMEFLKKQGLWLACCDMDGAPLFKQDLKGSIGLVIGGEGDGVSRLVKEHCDFTVSIPMTGEIDSLNASVAAGIFMYEVVRQRRFT